MLSERFLELGSFSRLKYAFGHTSPWNAAGTFLAVAVLAVLGDYIRMLRLRAKMVRFGAKSSPSARPALPKAGSTLATERGGKHLNM